MLPRRAHANSYMYITYGYLYNSVIVIVVHNIIEQEYYVNNRRFAFIQYR